MPHTICAHVHICTHVHIHTYGSLLQHTCRTRRARSALSALHTGMSCITGSSTRARRAWSSCRSPAPRETSVYVCMYVCNHLSDDINLWSNFRVHYVGEEACMFVMCVSIVDVNVRTTFTLYVWCVFACKFVYICMYVFETCLTVQACQEVRSCVFKTKNSMSEAEIYFFKKRKESGISCILDLKTTSPKHHLLRMTQKRQRGKTSIHSDRGNEK